MYDRRITLEDFMEACTLAALSHIWESIFKLAKGNWEKEVIFEQALKEWGGPFFTRHSSGWHCR